MKELLPVVQWIGRWSRHVHKKTKKEPSIEALVTILSKSKKKIIKATETKGEESHKKIDFQPREGIELKTSSVSRQIVDFA